MGTSAGLGAHPLSDACSNRKAWSRRTSTTVRRELVVDMAVTSSGVDDWNVHPCASMCIPQHFGSSTSFRSLAQGNPNSSGPIVLDVKIAIAFPADRETASPPAAALAPSSGQRGSAAALPAVFVALLAWAALLCAGFGGTVGVISQTLAGKLAASAQFLQRQGGTSSTARALRRELPAVATSLTVVEAARAVVKSIEDAAPPASAIAPRVDQRHTDGYLPVAAELRLGHRHPTPPSHAPPSLA